MTYWQERFIQLEEAQHNKSLEVIQGIDDQFRHAQSAIEGKINAWYQRFAKNNGISMVEAKRLLNSDELAELQWDVGEYIKHGRENAINQQWMRELENASAKVHISRLEALKLQCQQEAEKLYGNYTDAIDAHIADIYTGGYYHTAYELQRGVGVGSVLNEFNSNLVEKVIHKPWAVDGRNFSDRIWTDKTRLINNLHNSLTKMCITGEAPDRAIREISQNMHVSRQQAARIVQTEAAAFSSMAQEDCYKDLNVEQFEVVSTLDSGTCHSCGSMDGNHFPMTEYQIGVTVPPFHPRCRCCTAPYFGDEYDNIGKRAARDEAGRTYDVPADMTYREWKKSFVDGGKVMLDMQNTQEYRPITKDTKEYIDQRGQVEIHTRRIVNATYDGGIYLSDTVNIKRKQMHNMELSLNQAVELVGKGGNLPKCIVVSSEEMQTGAVCAYNAGKNVMYINSVVTDMEKLLKLQEGMACPDNPLSTYVHEFIHWKDAQEYLKKNEFINSKEYLQELRKKCKKKLDKLEQQGYDVEEGISEYAQSCYARQYYDEVYTEYRTKIKLGGEE